jgi:hypothetical protein
VICHNEINCLLYAESHLQNLSCRQIYHTECIRMWTNKSNTCPICREIYDTDEIWIYGDAIAEVLSTVDNIFNRKYSRNLNISRQFPLCDCLTTSSCQQCKIKLQENRITSSQYNDRNTYTQHFEQITLSTYQDLSENKISLPPRPPNMIDITNTSFYPPRPPGTECTYSYF